MQAIKAANKKIPDEIAIIGFASEPFGEYITPSLYNVNQQTVRMGEEAANLFFDSLHYRNINNGNPSKLVLKPELIYRQSSIKHYN
ncbi:MAG: substrate-binding domain-containing protein [Ferruginibacter sp.]